MRNVALFLSWFLLVPYFAVRELDVRPWFKGQRETANRSNGAIVVALIVTLTVFGAAPAVGKGNVPLPFLLTVYCAVFIATFVFLGRERERRYRAAYSSMPLWQRGAFGFATLAFVLLLMMS
jgi:hypothetical protein